MDSLYDRLGGEAAVNAAVEVFYHKVLADPRIRHFFDGVNMEHQIKKQKAFLTFAFGGSSHYTGKGLRNGHKHLVEGGLDDTHVDAVIGHLCATLKELGVDEADIKEAASIAESVRNDVLNRSAA